MPNTLKTNQSIPAMEIGYRSKGRGSLGAQLSGFAARKIISKAVDIGARHLEDKLTSNLTKSHRYNSTKPNQRNYTMFTDQNTNTNQNTNTSNNSDREPVEVWVNNMVVMKAGDQPVQIGMGRPLSTYKSDAPVNTQNEEFNARNAVSNVFVRGMQGHAAKLEPETGKILGQELEGGGYAVGTYIQVYRAKTDFAADEAAKLDRESAIEDTFAAAFG